MLILMLMLIMMMMFLVVVTNQISSLIAQFPASKRRYRRKSFSKDVSKIFTLKKFNKVSPKKVQKPISKFPTKGQGGLAKKFLIQLLLKVPTNAKMETCPVSHYRIHKS